MLARFIRSDPVRGGESIPMSGDGRAAQDEKSWPMPIGALFITDLYEVRPPGPHHNILDMNE